MATPRLISMLARLARPRRVRRAIEPADLGTAFGMEWRLDEAQAEGDTPTVRQNGRSRLGGWLATKGRR